jgi:hypothetical protein
LQDPTGHDSLAFALAYLHPLWMLGSLALAIATLRAGLRLRRARRLGGRKNAADYRRHLRLAKPTLAALGFAGGIASSIWLRGWEALATTHAAVAVAALLAFLATGVLGHRLENGDRAPLEWHARLAGVATLLAAAAIGTGFVLLP